MFSSRQAPQPGPAPPRPSPWLLIIFLAVIGLLIAVRPLAEIASPSLTLTPVEAAVQQAAATAIPFTPSSAALLATTLNPTATLPFVRQGDLLPTSTPQPTPTPVRLQEHTVQAGESLVSIAILYNITPQSIASVNFLADENLVYPGQLLLVPLFPRPAIPAETLLPTIQAALEMSSQGPAILGYSVLDRPVELYTFGSGPNILIFIGGIHGGYEWNSTVLAYQAIDYFTAEPTAVPESVTVYIIPAANPDGIYAVTGKSGPITITDVIISDTFPARFNANGVDLNRNWDCDWSPTAVWWDTEISGGSAPFSEPETRLLQTFIESQRPGLKGVIFWHSSAFLVSPGQCGDTIHQPSNDIAAIYAQAARYPTGAFSAYPITGESANWLAKVGIPAFSVELSSHESLDWSRNLAGMRALLSQYDS
jgi:LysM repeat protein